MNQLKKEVRVFMYFIKKALKISKTYPVVVLISSVLSAVAPFIAIIFPKYIIDELLGKQRLDVFVWLIAVAAGTAFAVNLLTKRCERYLNVKYKEVINEFEARTALLLSGVTYEKLESPDFIDLKERAMSPIINRGILYTFFSAVPVFMKNVITLTSALIVICTFDLTVVIGVLLVLAVSAYFNSMFQRKDIILQKDTIQANKVFVYNIRIAEERNIAKDVRLNDLSEFIMSGIREWDRNELKNRAKPFYRNRHFYEGVKNFFAVLQNFVVYAYIGVRAIQKSISIGSFSMYISAAATFGSAASKTIGLFAEMRQNCRYLEDYMLLNETPVEAENGKKLRVSDNKIEIEFKNVSFSYPKTHKPILKNVNLKIRNGETLSIVGRNGAGKTTLIKLLSRLFKPDSGEILLNGVNISDIDYKEYIRLLAIVFQDFKIFELTVADNVGFENYDERRVEQALEKAGILEFINTLPQKTKTYIGKSSDKDGTFFSGGQLQKIAIARTICKDSPMVLLDEPTASLDPISESEVYEKFNELIGEKTAIYISHRMSSCKFCDRIVFINNGEIEEEGSHDELMKRGGKYAKMFMLQADSYKNA
jgi:ATP-binding cassette subfamily B protein/ATP-binding cassette subfamily C protein